jgi:hypothetical protein
MPLLKQMGSGILSNFLWQGNNLKEARIEGDF